MSHKINSFISSDKDVASYEKRLSICLSTNGFSFSIKSTSDELLAIGDVACKTDTQMAELLTDVRNAFAEMHIQPFGLKNVELIIPSSQFVWIPQHLYDETRKNSYLESLCTIPSGYGVYSEYNDTIKAHLVYSANNSTVSAFKIALPGLQLHCQHFKMVNQTLVDMSDLCSVLMINVRAGESDFAVFCNKKLQLSNTFKCENIDETAYHALNITKQFRLEDAPLSVVLCGEIDRNSYSKLRPFFQNVSLYTGSNLRFSVPEMQHVATYRYALTLS